MQGKETGSKQNELNLLNSIFHSTPACQAVLSRRKKCKNTTTAIYLQWYVQVEKFLRKLLPNVLVLLLKKQVVLSYSLPPCFKVL